MAMEFWGVEVKSGEALKVEPGRDMLVHISQATIGERKKDKAGETICVYLSVNNQKFVLGTLSHDKFPQITTEIVLEKGFELSHSWKNGSVYFTGYKVDAHEHDSMSENEEDAEEAGKIATDNGEAKPKLKQAKEEARNPGAATSGAVSKKVNFKEPNKDIKPKQEDNDGEDEDDDMSSEESSDDEDQTKVDGEESSDESDDDDDDESSDEETPKPGPSKKRPAEAAVKTPPADKKLKSAGLQKTDGKKSSGHVDTPHPAKRPGRKLADTKESQLTPKSAGSYSCKSCNRSFTSEVGLQSHTKAKHTPAA